MLRLAKKLFPINRSLTGKGNIQTLKILKNLNKSLKIKNFKTGEKVFDWTIPKVWNVKEAHIITPENKKICDFKKNNLHLVGYSEKVNKKINLKNLNKNLYSIPKIPNAIPYVTSYYTKNWGFCIAHSERKNLKKGIYKVKINRSLKKGFLHYGEIYIKGKLKKEIVFSTYICHPSMANNEISGIVVAIYLSNYLKKKKRKFSYRIIFAPETIGAIAYINKNQENLKQNVISGYIITCVGDERAYSLIPSREKSSLSNKMAKQVLKKLKSKVIYYHWKDRRSDERQYCYPGIDLPFSSIMRSKYHSYPEYHTSLDKIGTVVTEKGLQGSLNLFKKLILNFENKIIPFNTIRCEPFMSKKKLYHKMMTYKNKSKFTQDIMNILSFCDGKHTIEDICGIFNLKKSYSINILKILKKKKLVDY